LQFILLLFLEDFKVKFYAPPRCAGCEAKKYFNNGCQKRRFDPFSIYRGNAPGIDRRVTRLVTGTAYTQA
jgi:hypothetical protein